MRHTDACQLLTHHKINHRLRTN